MAYSILRTQLIDDISYRLADNRAGVQARWSEPQISQAIANALLRCEPLGEEVVIELDKTAYDATPQGSDTVLFIRRIEGQNTVVFSSAIPDPPVPLNPKLYRLNKGQDRWLYLRNGLDTSDVLYVDCIRRIDPQASSIPLDAELVIAYAMQFLYERYTTRGSAGARDDDMIKAQEYRAIGDQRKAELMIIQYPPPKLEEEQGPTMAVARPVTRRRR
jgi:hypothetical protein